MRYFSIFHGVLTIMVFALHISRKKDVYDAMVVFLPKAYRIFMTVCAIIFVFPFIPYLVDGEWNDAYYVLIPAAILSNAIRVIQLNWRIDTHEEIIVYRNAFGFKSVFSPNDVSIERTVLRSHRLITPKGKVFVPNDAQNIESLICIIDRNL